MYYHTSGAGTTQRVTIPDRQSRHRPMPVRTAGDGGRTRSGGMSRNRRTTLASVNGGLRSRVLFDLRVYGRYRNNRNERV